MDSKDVSTHPGLFCYTDSPMWGKYEGFAWVSPGQLSLFSLLDSSDFYDINSIILILQRRKLRIWEVTLPKVSQLVRSKSGQQASVKECAQQTMVTLTLCTCAHLSKDSEKLYVHTCMNQRPKYICVQGLRHEVWGPKAAWWASCPTSASYWRGPQIGNLQLLMLLLSAVTCPRLSPGLL